MITDSKNINIRFRELHFCFRHWIELLFRFLAKISNYFLQVTATVSPFLKNLFNVGYDQLIMAFTGCTETERDSDLF